MFAIDSKIVARFCGILMLVVLLFASAGCSTTAKIPLYKPDITPRGVLRLMEKRAFLLGGIDCDLDIKLESNSSKTQFSSSLIFDAPDKYRLQIAFPGELPVMDVVLLGRQAKFLLPGALVKLSSTMDIILRRPVGFTGLVDSTTYLTGNLPGFVPYGAKLSGDIATHFVYMRKCGNLEIRAFVNRTTLAITKVIYSTGDSILFEVFYGNFIAAGEGIIPRQIQIRSSEFNIFMTVNSFQLASHSITDFIFDEMPGTVSVRTIESFMEKFYGKNSD